MDSLTNLLNTSLDVADIASVQSTISTIDKYMTNLSTQVEQSIDTQYSDVSKAKNDTDNIYIKAKQYMAEFQDLNVSLSKDTEIEIVSTEDIQKSLMNKMLKSESMIAILHQLCQCHEIVEESSECTDVAQEAEKLKLAEIKLKAMCNGDQSITVVAALQEKIHDRLLSIFKSVSDWSNIVSIQNHSFTFVDGAQSTLDKKTHVLEVIARGELTTIADIMASRIQDEILNPVINNNFKISFGRNKITVEDSTLSKVNSFDQILQFLLLLNAEILPTNSGFRTDFWRSIFDYLIPKLKADCIKAEIPDQLSELDNFAKEYVPAVEAFESGIECLIENFNCSLTDYVNSYHILFAQKYKERCYTEARIILQSDPNAHVSVSTVISKVDVEPKLPPPRDPCSPLTLSYPKTNQVLHLPEFPVSQKAVHLAELILKIILEATSDDLSDAAAQCLCNTGRNIAELFQIPSFDPFDDTENPQKAARFFCDCWFLSHQLFWGTLELKDRLPKETFIEVVCLLRSKGALSIKNNFESLLNKAKTLINQIGGLDGQNRENHGMVIEMAFVQIVALISDYACAWKKNLPQDRYQKLLGTTIDKTLQFITSETLKIEDISAKHSTCLSNNFSLLIDQLDKLRGDDIPEDSEAWIRFISVRTIMDDSLIKIVENWENGTLAQHFKATEVQHLTRALFQNTDKNANLRRRITGEIM